jgi:hypothetical protein
MNVHRQTSQQSFCFDSFPCKNSELQTQGDCQDTQSCPGRFGFCGFHGNFVLLCYRDLVLALSGLNHDARIQEELCLVKKRF